MWFDGLREKAVLNWAPIRVRGSLHCHARVTCRQSFEALSTPPIVGLTAHCQDIGKGKVERKDNRVFFFSVMRDTLLVRISFRYGRIALFCGQVQRQYSCQRCIMIRNLSRSPHERRKQSQNSTSSSAKFLASPVAFAAALIAPGRA